MTNTNLEIYEKKHELLREAFEDARYDFYATVNSACLDLAMRRFSFAYSIDGVDSQSLIEYLNDFMNDSIINSAILDDLTDKVLDIADSLEVSDLIEVKARCIFRKYVDDQQALASKAFQKLKENKKN